MPPRKRRVPNVDPSPPEEDPGVYVVVVHDRSIATINALGRVCDAYLSPIVDRLRTLAGTDNAHMARLVYTRPSLAESPELVSYKSGFLPVAQAIASMKAGAAGEPTDALSLVDAIMVALQMFDAQLTRPASIAREPILHILVATSNPPQMTANRQDSRSLSQWRNAPLQILQRRVGLSLVLLSPPNQHLLTFFQQIAGEATVPWFPVKTDEVHLSGLSEHVASAQPNAPQPQGRKRRRDEDEEDGEAAVEGPRPKKSPRKSARTAEKTLSYPTQPILLPPTATYPLTQPQPSDSRSNPYSGPVEPSASSYGAEPNIAPVASHHADADIEIGANGGNWAALAELGAYLNQPEVFARTDFGGQYAVESPDVGAFFSDNSLAAASYAHAAAASTEIQQFPTVGNGSNSDAPFNPSGSQCDVSTSSRQIPRNATSFATQAETRSYIHSTTSTACQYGVPSTSTDVVQGGAHLSPGHALGQASPDTSPTASNLFCNTTGATIPGREDQLPKQNFGIPQVIQLTPTTPSRAPSQLQSLHAQYGSPSIRSQVLGLSNFSTISKASGSPLQPGSTADRPQPVVNPPGPTPARATIGNSPMQSFSPRHSQQQPLQQASPKPLSHHTPGSTASRDGPSASSETEVTGDEENYNQPIFNSGHLVGGNPSKVALMVAISVDGLFFDGPTPKRLRVPITVVSSPDQNVRTDLWPKPTFAVTPESLSGPVVWQEFFSYLAKGNIPTCSLKANTRTAGGIRPFVVEYLASFDKTCRLLIERTSFARVPFRVPGGPPEAGIALFPSIEQQGAGVSLHAAYFGNINIPRAEDISPLAKTKRESKEPTDAFPAPTTTGILASPLRRSSVPLNSIHSASPVSIVPPLPYSPRMPVAGPFAIPPGPQIQPAPAHLVPQTQLVGGGSHRIASSVYPPPPRVLPYAAPGRGPLPPRSTSDPAYSPTGHYQQSPAYRPPLPPRVVTAPYPPTIATWSSSPIVSSPDAQIGQYGTPSPRHGTHTSMVPSSYNMPTSNIAGGNTRWSSSSQAQPVDFSLPIYGVHEPQQPPAVHFATSVRNHKVQAPVLGQPPPRPPYPAAHYQRSHQMSGAPDATDASVSQGTSYTPFVEPPPLPPQPQSQSQPQPHPQGGYVQNPYPYPYPYPYSQS